MPTSDLEETNDGAPLEGDPTVIPSAFEARQKMLDDIAGNADEFRIKGGEFDAIEDETPPDNTQADPEQDAAPEPEKHKIKVNGREMELTMDELIARASKVEAADEYLREAKEERRRVQEVQPSVPDVAPVGLSDDDARALARALQMGSEEEAAAAIKRLAPRPSGITPDVVAGVARSQIALDRARELAESRHKDLIQHPVVGKYFRQRLNQLAAENPDTPLLTGYDAVAEEMRKDFGSVLKPVSPKLERKMQSPTPPSAGGRKPLPSDDEGEENVSSVIDGFAKARHQGMAKR